MFSTVSPLRFSVLLSQNQNVFSFFFPFVYVRSPPLKDKHGTQSVLQDQALVWGRIRGRFGIQRVQSRGWVVKQDGLCVSIIVSD